ncbi:hypothetical protein F5887DRAFT_971335, partial [Amanita rubescens]
MGDAQFGMRGGTTSGWMTFGGTKRAGTDLHSKTAKQFLDHAKIYRPGMSIPEGQNIGENLHSFPWRYPYPTAIWNWRKGSAFAV